MSEEKLDDAIKYTFRLWKVSRRIIHDKILTLKGGKSVYKRVPKWKGCGVFGWIFSYISVS